MWWPWRRCWSQSCADRLPVAGSARMPALGGNTRAELVAARRWERAVRRSSTCWAAVGLSAQSRKVTCRPGAPWPPTRHAAGIWRHLFAATHEASRLYALFGLTQLRSPALPQALNIALRDSTEVRIIVWSGQPGDTAPPHLDLDALLPLSALIKPGSLTLWASLLSQPPAARCAA